MTTEQDQSTTEDRPDKAASSTTDRPIASGDGRSAQFCCQRTGQPGNRRQQRFRTIHRRHRSAPHARLRRPDPSRSVAIDGRRGHGVRRVSGRHDARRRIRRCIPPPKPINWLAAFPSTVLTQLATTVIVVIVLAQLLLAREWLQAAVSALAMFAGYGIVWVISTAISSLNDSTLPMALVSAATSYGSGCCPTSTPGMASFLTAAGHAVPAPRSNGVGISCMPSPR